MSEVVPNADPAPRVPLWLEFFGWYGTLAILGAYAGNEFGWFEDLLAYTRNNFDWPAEDSIYFGWLDEKSIYDWLNLTGAIGVGWVCLARRTWQAFSLELVWALIALSALTSSP